MRMPAICEKYMKVGDYVAKIDGARHNGRQGIVLEIFNTEKGGWKIAKVLSEGELISWPCHLLEVVNESR